MDGPDDKQHDRASEAHPVNNPARAAFQRADHDAADHLAPDLFVERLMAPGDLRAQAEAAQLARLRRRRGKIEQAVRQPPPLNEGLVGPFASPGRQVVADEGEHD
ncbi:MAG: hypothetical protein ACRDNO_04425 [Trebonia sp.]